MKDKCTKIWTVIGEKAEHSSGKSMEGEYFKERQRDPWGQCAERAERIQTEKYPLTRVDGHGGLG